MPTYLGGCGLDVGRVEGGLDGWVEGWPDGWVGVRPGRTPEDEFGLSRVTVGSEDSIGRDS